MNLSTGMQEKLLEYRKILEFIQSTPEYNKYIPADVMDAIKKNLSRLEYFQFSIAAFGETNSGKSALLNALVGADNSEPSEQIFEVSAEINHWSDDFAELNGKEVCLGKDIDTVFYDTPGIAGDIEQHKDIALKIAKNCDILLFVLFEPIKNQLQVPIIQELLDTNKECIFVINKSDIRRKEEIEAIEKDIMDKFDVPKDKIICAAGHPMNGKPQIEKLVERIISIITTLQGDLITRTIELQLDKPYKQIIDEIEKAARQKQMEMDEKLAEQAIKISHERKNRLLLNHFIIHGAATGAGTGALLLAQVPGGDELVLTGITVTMTAALCKNYNKFSRQLVLTYLNVISGTLIGTMAASYLYRWVPFLGNIINCAVTASLHEIQGWLVVSFLEKGLYTKEDIEKAGIENLKMEAEILKDSAEEVRNSPEFSADKLKELKKQAEKIMKDSESFSETIDFKAK